LLLRIFFEGLAVEDQDQLDSTVHSKFAAHHLGQRCVDNLSNNSLYTDPLPLGCLCGRPPPPLGRLSADGPRQLEVPRLTPSSQFGQCSCSTHPLHTVTRSHLAANQCCVFHDSRQEAPRPRAAGAAGATGAAGASGAAVLWPSCGWSWFYG